MARKKKEENVEEVVSDEEQTEDVAEKEKATKNLVTEQDTNTEEDTAEEAAAVYKRATPFGVEVWDPKTKTTTMKTHG
ncbi:hypothetical protein [Enterococcus sp. DIV1054d]|uniref:hypothetical protein n=1 Tax=Enterococcus sp. DIV1054d TaxID=2774789 RepID=UPI003D2FAAA5